MLALHRLEPAKQLLNAIVKRNANDVHAWFLLARAGIATNDPYTTGQAAKNVQRLAPGDPQVVLIEAYARVQSGELAEAEAVLRQALERDDHNALVHCMLGLVAERAEEPAAARTHYRAALRVDPACRWAQEALRRIDAGGEGIALRGHPALAADGALQPQ
jgi:cytochrome c-type biogenesis protein CcmH/NrfG